MANMTWKDKITIDTNALLEELGQYQYMSETYCSQMRMALSPFNLDKLIFCLKSIKEWFEEKQERYDGNSDYRKLKTILFFLDKQKADIEKRAREAIPLMQFWTAFSTWLSDEAQDPATLFCQKYQESYSDFGQWHTVGCVNKDNLYKSTYGKSYIEVTEQNISFQVIKEFVEAYYREVIEPIKGRLKYTVKANDLFVRFQLPCRLQKGKLTQSGYKTTYKIDKIENYEQFERKIDFAAEMILYGDLLDKHTALNYIADAFCYFYSLYKKDSDKKLGELVNPDNNTRIYALIKSEVSFIGQVINDDFDIRHNEESSAAKNGQQRKREILNDPIFIEYLYNRINSLLMLLRIKRNQKQKTEQVKEEDLTPTVDDDDLPF